MVPKHRFRKFAVVSDRQRHEELVAQRGETSVWYRRPTPGFDLSCTGWGGLCFRVGFFVGILGVGWSFRGTKAAVGSGG